MHITSVFSIGAEPAFVLLSASVLLLWQAVLLWVV